MGANVTTTPLAASTGLGKGRIEMRDFARQKPRFRGIDKLELELLSGPLQAGATRNRGTSRGAFPQIRRISPAMVSPSAVRVGMILPITRPGPEGSAGRPIQA